MKKLFSIIIICILLSCSFIAITNATPYEKEEQETYQESTIPENTDEGGCNCGLTSKETKTYTYPTSEYGSDSTIEKINEEIQKKQASWVASANPIYMKSDAEKRLLLGSLEETGEQTGEEIATTEPFTGSSLPTHFDWRNVHGQNYLTPVHSQSGCGSCWAFGAIATVEGNAKAYFNKPNLALDLSEQDLVSCSGTGSCGGGFSSDALVYIRDNGVAIESCFDYTHSDESCSNKC